jgi:hypothetical protein
VAAGDRKETSIWEGTSRRLAAGTLPALRPSRLHALDATPEGDGGGSGPAPRSESRMSAVSLGRDEPVLAPGAPSSDGGAAELAARRCRRGAKPTLKALWARDVVGCPLWGCCFGRGGGHGGVAS